MRKPVAQGSGIILLGLVWKTIERWTVIDALEKSVPALHGIVFSEVVQGALVGAGAAWILSDWLAGKPHLTGEVKRYHPFWEELPDGSRLPRIAVWLEVSNNGAKGVVTEWSLRAKAGRKTFKGASCFFPGPITIGGESTYHLEDALINKVLSGVEKWIPVNGFVTFQMPPESLEHLGRKGTRISVGLRDAAGKWRYCRYSVPEKPSPGPKYLAGTVVPKPPASSSEP